MIRPQHPALLLALAAPATAQVHLTQASPADIGTTMTIQITGATPSSPLYFTGSPSLLDPPASPGTYGLLYCAAPRVTVPLGSSNSLGALTTGLPVPSSSAFLGLVLPMQALDLGALPAMNGTVLSNPLAAWIGPHPVSISPNSESGGRYGFSVAIGDFVGSSALDVAVGAELETVAGTFGVGRVYIYAGPSFTGVTELSSPTPQVGGQFGWSLVALDWNGDGATDLAVGEPGHDGVFPFTDIGEVHVFPHPVGGAGASTFTDPSPVTSEQMGVALAAGQLDATPNEELVVGASFHGGSPPTGVFTSVKILTYPGGTANFGEVSEPNESGGLFGDALALGDVDGDGFDEILVGEPAHDEPGASGAGEVHLIDAGVITLSLLEDTPGFGARFGTSVALGDLDGDGLADLLVGVQGQNAAHVYVAPAYQGESPVVLTPALPGDLGGGRTVAIADVNGDSKLDALLGASSCGVGGSQCGSLTAYLGHALAARSQLGAPDLSALALAAGDVDGDGRDEIAIGSPFSAPSFLSNAGAYLLSK